MALGNTCDELSSRLDEFHSVPRSVAVQRSHHIPLAIKTISKVQTFTPKYTGLAFRAILDLKTHEDVSFWLPNPRHLPAVAVIFCQPLPRALLLEQVALAASLVSQGVPEDAPSDKGRVILLRPTPVAKIPAKSGCRLLTRSLSGCNCQGGIRGIIFCRVWQIWMELHSHP